MSDLLLQNIIPTQKDPPQEEMIKEHLKALDRKPFDKVTKETGVTHQVKDFDKILDKSRPKV